jgi:hypothetical protein
VSLLLLALAGFLIGGVFAMHQQRKRGPEVVLGVGAGLALAAAALRLAGG